MVRRESAGIRRYCHLATGNYNVNTSGIYGDFGLFTCRESFGDDLTDLFNLLTGYTRPQAFHHLLVAPTSMREGMIERDTARSGTRSGGQAGQNHRQDQTVWLTRP